MSRTEWDSCNFEYMPEDIQDKIQHYIRLPKGTSRSSLAEIKRHKYSQNFGIEGYDYSFVDVKLSKNDKEKTIRMFSKSIDTKMANEEDRCSPDEVLRRYDKLKEAGLPVPPTLRISEDGKHILMTDLTQNGKYEIIDRHNTYSDIQIRNPEQVRNEIANAAVSAKNAGFIFSPDAFAVLVDKQTGIGNLAILDIGSGIYSEKKIKLMHKEHYEDLSEDEFKEQLALESADTFGFMIALDTIDS